MLNFFVKTSAVALSMQQTISMTLYVFVVCMWVYVQLNTQVYA